MVVGKTDGDRDPTSRYRLLSWKRCAAGRHHLQRGRRIDGYPALARLSHEHVEADEALHLRVRTGGGSGGHRHCAHHSCSAILAGYESINRVFHPQVVQFLWAVVAASLIGFAGNEIVAVFRINVGKEIGSAALIADGHHACIDGLTSLAVFFGAVGVYLGSPLADPLVGLVITVAILRIVWGSGKEVFTRAIDGIDPAISDEIRDAPVHTEGVKDVTEVRVRWSSHRLHAEVNIAADPESSVEAGHVIAKEVRHQLLHHLAYLSNAVIHVDPLNALGEEHHYVSGHDYGDLTPHRHDK